ncbi:MAG: NAD-dependent epimerase/dehydratase family protein [Myxococcota bacterium]
MAHIVITGAAGFIGYHLAARLLDEGYSVLGIDDLNAFYPVHHKERRRDRLIGRTGFTFVRADVAEATELDDALNPSGPLDRVVHLAAHPSVLASAREPERYLRANLVGFTNVLEACRVRDVPLLFASSSSVYGPQTPPLTTTLPLAPPQSLYAATKVANEALAMSYAAQHDLPVVAVRFFNVYGPFGRPDMAVYRFTEQILRSEPLQLRNHGRMTRDLTYIDDAVEAVVRLLARDLEGAHTVNVGRGVPVSLDTLVAELERLLERKAITQAVARPPSEVVDSWAGTDELERLTAFRPRMDLRTGLDRFIRWYRDVERG